MYWGKYLELLSGGWRRPVTDELHALYFSPNVIRAIRSWRM